MDDNLTGILIVIISIAGLVCLRYMKLRMQGRGALNGREREAMARMAETALRLEQRVAVLEQILDGELPCWRGQPANFYRQVS